MEARYTYIMKRKVLASKKEIKPVEHRFGVLLEHMDKKLDLVVEGHVVLDKKLDNFKEDVDGRFDEIDYKLEAMAGELHVVRNELKEKVGRDEFLLLEKRVMALEKKVTHKN